MTVACWPDLISAPLPAIRVSAFSAVGAAPLPFGTVGFVLMSASPGVGSTFWDVGAVASGTGCWFLASDSALAADLSAALSLVLLPHPAASSASTSRAARGIDRVFAKRVIGATLCRPGRRDGAPLGPPGLDPGQSFAPRRSIN